MQTHTHAAHTCVRTQTAHTAEARLYTPRDTHTTTQTRAETRAETHNLTDAQMDEYMRCMCCTRVYVIVSVSRSNMCVSRMCVSNIGMCVSNTGMCASNMCVYLTCVHLIHICICVCEAITFRAGAVAEGGSNGIAFNTHTHTLVVTHTRILTYNGVLACVSEWCLNGVCKCDGSDVCVRAFEGYTCRVLNWCACVSE